MPAPAGLIVYQLQYAISPIIFTGGVASGLVGAALPIVGISSALSFPLGALAGVNDATDLDDFLNFQPLQGSSLIDQQIGMYPFANQQTAANATIQQPLAISMLMLCPAGAAFGYATKPSVMASIQQSFDQHNKSGGTYSIMTVSFTYTDCVMLAMTDISSTLTKQNQTGYKLDFLKPLVTLAAAAQAYNNQMGQIANNLPATGAPAGNPVPTSVIPGTVSAGPGGLSPGGAYSP